MLPPDSRTTLLTRLTPPPGYVLDHLVGTTFTLDLESALLPSLALAGSAKVSAADRVETIAAIRSSIGAIDIFHQNGTVAVPRDRVRLFSLLEDAIHGITATQGLFHPKLWLGVYSHPSELTVLRLIVLSRNLTKDRSWDVALTLNGTIYTTPSAQNKPLVDLLRYLPTATTTPIKPAHAKRMSELAETMRYARWDLPAGATALEFHVFGVPGMRRPQTDFSGYNHLVVSPFLSDDGLEHVINGARGPVAVVSRQESLNSLGPDIAGRIETPYILSATAGIPAEDESSGGGSILTGLHAKIYSVERQKLAHIFFGSANATGAAFTRNVEILIELTGSSKVFGVDKLLSGDGFGSILESASIESVTTEADPQVALDTYLRSIAALPLRAVVGLNEDDRASVHITSASPIPTSDGVTLAVSLLTDPSTAKSVESAARIDITYLDVALADVTAFMVLTATDEEGRSSATLVKAELIGDLPDRLDTIVTNEINDPDGFRRFLALLLAFGDIADDDESGAGSAGSSAGRWSYLEQGLFEQLLRASTSRPEVLDQLSGIVTTIVAKGDPNKVLPEGFSDLWSAINTAVNSRSGADA